MAKHGQRATVPSGTPSTPGGGLLIILPVARGVWGTPKFPAWREHLWGCVPRVPMRRAWWGGRALPSLRRHAPRGRAGVSHSWSSAPELGSLGRSGKLGCCCP